MKKIVLITISAILFFTILIVFPWVYTFYNEPSWFSAESFKAKNYTQEELILFNDIGFSYDNKIRKWETDIKVEIKNRNEITPQDVADVDSCITILSPLILPLKMERVTSGGNFHVYASTEKKLPTKDNLGLGCAETNRKTFYKREITEAIIYEIKNLYRKDILLHEFEHALGLSHAKGKYNYLLNMQSVDNPYILKSEEESDSILDNRFYITEQEKKVIKMLYSSDFKSGLSRKFFMKEMNINDGN
jgi:hypothetical protein